MKQLLSISLLALLMSVSACKSDKKTDRSKTDKHSNVQPKTTPNGDYTINPAATVVTWKGIKPTGFHTGTVPVKNGSIQVTNGKISGGHFTLDLANLTNTDLPKGEDQDNLLGHLKGTIKGKENDFFNVTKFPTGTFVLTKATELSNDPNYNHILYGSLTLKDISKPVAFKAHISTDANTLTATTETFKINRTEWGINFLSKSVFEKLKDRFINDEIELKVNLSATK